MPHIVRTGALVFGVANVVLPLLEQSLVPNGWIDLQQFLVGGPLLLRGVWFDPGLIHSSAESLHR